MSCKRLISLILLTSIISSCSIADVNNSIKGSYYMETGDYQQAVESFKKTVKANPENAIAHYYLGRFLLAQEKTTEALPHFQQAVRLDKRDADYYFWLGVNYGELGDSKTERLNYEKALRISKRHLQANLYMGHLQLKEGEIKQAIKSYDLVLKEVPTNAAALYNRALILDIEGKDASAKEAWLEYLKWYPAGRHALRATDHLNTLGDFSYENHFLGARTITLSEIKFQRTGNKVSVSSLPSLRLVGAIVSNHNKGTLQVVVYVNKNKQLAQQRAVEIKTTLLELFPAIARNRIQISWFGSSDKVSQGGKIYTKNESIRVFLTDWN